MLTEACCTDLVTNSSKFGGVWMGMDTGLPLRRAALARAFMAGPFLIFLNSMVRAPASSPCPGSSTAVSSSGHPPSSQTGLQ